jgi:glycosyltransferase involved in cell wall biosynthesis
VSSVVFICQVFWPDTQATSQLFSDLLGPLATRGFEITVLAGHPAGNEAKHTPDYELWKGMTIRRGGGRWAFKKGMIRRALAYASYLWFVFWRLLFVPEDSSVFVVSNPPFAPLVAGAVCRRRKLHWMVVLHDVYPDGLTALGRLRPGGRIDRSWRRANRRALQAAERVWMIGRDMEQLVRVRYGLRPEKTRYVPNWSAISVAARRDAEGTRLWGQLGLNGKFVVQYSGNMGLWHDVDTIVRAAALLSGSTEIHFLFIGSGIKRAGAEKLSRQLGLVNVTWLSFRAREDLEDSLACCHAALVSQINGLEGVTVPCKLYGILASGRAVIAQVPAGSEAAMVVDEEKCGVVVRPGDADGLADAIRRLAGCRSDTLELGARAFDAYRGKYTLGCAVEAFSQGWSEWMGTQRTADAAIDGSAV